MKIYLRKNLIKKCKKIKIILTDVDGVLTDGGMYYSIKGDTMKRFYVRDGMGVTLLKKHNIHTIIVTKEKNQIIRQWAKKMKIKRVYDGVIHKELILDKICKIFKINSEKVAFMGDDINDVELLKKVGFSAVPNDGIMKAKKNSDYISQKKGGYGAFRELADLILISQKVKS